MMSLEVGCAKHLAKRVQEPVKVYMDFISLLGLVDCTALPKSLYKGPSKENQLGFFFKILEGQKGGCCARFTEVKIENSWFTGIKTDF